MPRQMPCWSNIIMQMLLRMPLRGRGPTRTMPQIRSIHICSVALILLCLDHPSFGADLPSNIDSILQNNIDKLQFDSFTISRTTQNQDGQWLCGTMNVRLATTGTYSTFKFVAQIYPEGTWGFPGAPQSWITVVGAGSDPTNVYGQHCS
jgi:hypothetical protein